MSKDKTSIVFTGDIGFDRYMARRWEDEKLLDEDTLAFFRSADHVAANVEGALIDAVDDGSRGVFFHSMDPAAASLLQKIGAEARADIENLLGMHVNLQLWVKVRPGWRDSAEDLKTLGYVQNR